MADAEEQQDATPERKSKLPLILGIVLALLLGGGGFLVTYTGMILAPGAEAHADAPALNPLPDIAFIPVDPLIISLGAAGRSSHLKLTAQLEVVKPHGEEVVLLMPRILDVLNGYLRAVEVAQLEDPTALVKLRSQMLRRIQMVTGEGRVRDLLITEFVLN